MIDFILWLFTFAVFYAGFWCGAKYGTIKGLFSAVRKQVQAWLA